MGGGGGKSRKTKILDEKFATIVLHINVRTDEILFQYFSCCT